MKILSVTAGAAGMYCGSCLRDNALATELMARGHDVTLLPLYTPATNWLKKPYVKGMYANPVTLHPWKFVYIEHDPSKWD